ncbi:MAG: alpha-L-fucosidase [Planctomycetes bacterium]|nr:alpha-L-fucosidase [Planctomycetota bacterium]
MARRTSESAPRARRLALRAPLLAAALALACSSPTDVTHPAAAGSSTGDDAVATSPGTPSAAGAPSPTLDAALIGADALSRSTAVRAPAPPLPIAPLPSLQQLAWHERPFYGFVHFGPNTFTGVEWGHGDEDPDVFRPTQLDCRQWARVAKEVGMAGLIITAKHHDGFCLWPSADSQHTVAQSGWRDGHGDVLRELSDACRAEGIGFGVYLSPWDRHDPRYGTPEYNRFFARQLEDVLASYGPCFEVWFDGANGEGPDGRRQEYDWPLFRRTVRKGAPDAVIFSDAGPDVRWVGNERGVGGETDWAMLRRDEFFPGTPRSDELTEGHRDGTHWVPAEADVSIRPGWFYTADDDARVKTPEQLFALWFASIGRGTSLLLNVPPDTRGLWADPDVASLRGLKRLVDATFDRDRARGAQVSASNVRGMHAAFSPGLVVDGDPESAWAADDGVEAAVLELDLQRLVTFDVVELREPIALGQRIARFGVEAEVVDPEHAYDPVDPSRPAVWTTLCEGTTIGVRRILRVPPVRTRRVRVHLLEARATPMLSEVSLWLAPPDVRIDPPGGGFVGATDVTLGCDVPGSIVVYTLDGSEPDEESSVASGPVRIDHSCTLRARAFADGKATVFAAEAAYTAVPASALHAPVTFVRAPDPGLRVEIFEGRFEALDAMLASEPVSRGGARGVDPSAAPRAEDVGLRFSGVLTVPRDGVFRFTLASDDGSRLRVAGETVVDLDGLHGMSVKSGEIALRAGWHEIEVDWFNASGGAGLALSWSGPGVAAGPVPAEAFAH